MFSGPQRAIKEESLNIAPRSRAEIDFSSSLRFRWRHNRVVDFQQQFGAVSLLFCFPFSGTGILEIQRIFHCDRDLPGNFCQQSGTIRRERLLAQTGYAQVHPGSTMNNQRINVFRL